MKRLWLALELLLIACCVAWAGGKDSADLPNPDLTPGVARAGVTAKQLCPIAHTAKVRNVTEAEKKQVYAEYGIKTHKPGQYEIDHLISLEIGGSNDIKNLWPQAYRTKPWNAHVKDRLENRLHAEVCAGRLSLTAAQHAISADWIKAYRQYFGNP